jgi:hypothetical protein
MNIGIGTEITKPTCHGERVGSVLVVKETRAEAESLAKEIVEMVSIETK